LHQVATEGRGGKGCVILFAAGNENAPLDGRKDDVTYYQGFALHPDVIAVGASNSLDLRSDYSNYGAGLTLCAPSSGSPGRGVVTTDRSGSLGYAGGAYTTTFGGTSSATPLAAGLAGLILSVNPDLTAAEVKQIMMRTADKIDEAHGRYENGYSPLYGHGRINAARAVEYASGRGQQLEETLVMERRMSRSIQDFQEAADVLTFPLEVAIEALEVGIDVRHTYVGDLRIVLTAPTGEEAVLHDRSGSGQQDLVRTYRTSGTAGILDRMRGRSARGDWKLTIRDSGAGDQGTLRKWNVGVTYRVG
jgi:subtilisin-like proprotein convertase family protein